ncbi:unnamed protein product [Orchesella dallaii]|uniref:Uncharacterized protein n=1 Tax=Orchesella dallaii TaxID=48710 RepID=A0ABP1RZM7_9HEXA
MALQSGYAQQTYQKKGNNYNAAVTIQRDVRMQNPYAPPAYQNQQKGKPWRQGDRLTKQELIQNIARALLSRKKTPSEKKEEERKKNEQNFQEYLMIQAGLAGKAQAPATAAVSQQSQQSQFRRGEVSRQNPNAYNPKSPQRFGQPSIRTESQNNRNYQRPGGNSRLASVARNSIRMNQLAKNDGQRRRPALGQQPRGLPSTFGYNPNALASNGKANQNRRAPQQYQPNTRVYMP